METKRASWASNLGFLMAAIGSAVGLRSEEHTSELQSR